MKFFLISDNTDTQMGLRLAGIEGVVVHTREQVLSELNKAIQDDSIAIVLMTTLAVASAPSEIAELKLKLSKPLIVEIPDRHGSAKIGETIDAYISEAIGIKI
ncbi:MAG: Archaeal/vacuolar-type H+-ATPase subunit F [Erysipelotrichaceae bacterium]|nr:MAG: Archaeal/vacuolar-type H+-ATPase subunit [Erysipelotrichaceae bacterium]TXT19736.1 MAG: Archaeal/vacuolar-type H+-ATPase subunit F [Erysipelotrichaceae bacterium]